MRSMTPSVMPWRESRGDMLINRWDWDDDDSDYDFYDWVEVMMLMVSHFFTYCMGCMCA